MTALLYRDDGAVLKILRRLREYARQATNDVCAASIEEAEDNGADNPRVGQCHDFSEIQVPREDDPPFISSFGEDATIG